ncbi:ATP-dependent DNA ligase LigD phosphoesterase module /ATP-dependent DNA ligase LigD polymerase module [Novosphingobium kunmingense]|uniref:DNA ligase (ATP) n=1 Tax=Novosphingobium kunmingense TaxID=1211806 RepID=A0A2N0HKE7_9SPHN|nr:DNA ligase D [Novosphingobium kunmingense]PKB19423.1 ATP-dependent DNA ligase LigD phosphoesterase module /ATP-dependent DNA ligase LigD polymerase module [Novosphingobium kunmingense]
MARRSSLSAYNAKRDFKTTTEPAGKIESSEGGNRFIVQKHDATRLHWDFRLEADGVLKSWAVTKGPSPDPDIKRLAVRTEDHPLAYAEFEGTIPKGEYGGGTVMLWDRGTWAPVAGKSWKDIDEGHIHFTLDGERMKGEWILFRLKPRPGEKRENWLLRKVQDEFVEDGDPLVDRALTSVLTRRSMAEIAADQKGSHSLAGKKGDDFAAEMAAAARYNKSKAKPARPRKAAPLPKFRAVQLATLVDAVPPGNGWMHEIKFDGYRALIAAKGAEVRVYTRNGKDWTDKFGPLVETIAALDLPACLIDGEIVATGKDGNPHFSTLQAVLKRGHGSQSARDRLEYHAFDLLEADGEDLTGLPNVERKERLEALLKGASAPIYVTDHVIGAGEKLLRTLCGAGQEGIIAKRIDAPYSGRRTKDWVKVKCTLRQEFVIVGWKASKARGRPFSSLLLAQKDGRKLVYRGNVGTGFDADGMADLAKRLSKLAVEEPPVEASREDARGVTWVKPALVAEIAFAELTAEGSVRHGSFVGLRGDKTAREVKAEKAEPAPRDDEVRISSRERVIFPESGLTKGDLADYYQAIAPLILPFAGRRPISLVRCPQGRGKQCFFQKHDSGSFGPHVRKVPIREGDGGLDDYIFVEDAAGLLACVQMGTIEFHAWASRSDAVEAPDRLIFDLDPDEGLSFADTVSAAKHLRDRLSDLGLVSFAMLSGGKGVHVIAPLTPGHDWDKHKDFARRFAEALSLAEPDRFVATMSKAKRKGRIFIDWLRNQRGATAVVPYSVRAREGAPVAVPVTWAELDKAANAHPWSIGDAKALIKRAQSKALAGWGFAEQRLPDI